MEGSQGAFGRELGWASHLWHRSWSSGMAGQGCSQVDPQTPEFTDHEGPCDAPRP